MLNRQGPKTEIGNEADQESGIVNATVLVSEIVLKLRTGNVATHKKSFL